MLPGEIHRYLATLKKGDFLRVTIDQDPVKGEEIDVFIRVVNQRGDQLVRVDSPSDAVGSEEVYLVADQDGVYCLEVGGFGKKGVYRIQRLFVRHASLADRESTEAEHLYFSGRAKIKERDYTGGFQDLLAAERRWNELGNIRRRADAMREAGLALDGKSEPEKSLKLRSTALSLYQSIGDLENESALLTAVANNQLQLGMLENADKSLRRALEIAQRIGNRLEEADAEGRLGALAEQKGDEFSALDLFEKSLAGWVALERYDNQVEALESIGRVYSLMGNFKDAMESFEKAEQIAVGINRQDLRGECLTRVSEVLRTMGRPEEALSFARRALTLMKLANDLPSLARTLNTMALIDREMENFDEAREAEEEALAIFRRLADPRSEATAHYNLGLILLETKDLKGAIEHFRLAVELARKVGFREGEIAGLYGMALGYRLTGGLTNAREKVEEALKLIEDVSGVTASAGLGSVFMESRFGSYRLLVELLAHSPSISEKEKKEAFEASERGRGRTLLESMPSIDGGLRRLSDTRLHLDLEKTKAQLAISEATRKKAEASGQPTKELREVQDRLERRSHMLEARIRNRAATAGPAPVSLEAAQSLLDSDTILLVYFLGKSGSFLWRVTPKSNEMYDIAGHDVLERACRNLQSLLSKSGPFDEKRAAATAEVSKLLLGPVAGRLDAKRIVVIADGPLNYVPFGLLRDPKSLDVAGSTDFLLATHEIVYEPSMSVLYAVRQEVARRPRPQRLLAVIAAPNLSAEEYTPLPYAQEEAQMLMSLVPKKQGFSAAGCHATRQLLLSEDFTSFRFLHLATHGEDHPGVPALSGIALSPSDCEGHRLDDGVLRLQDIKSLNLPVDMVVLSACKTALGKEVEGEGFEGLTEGFMAAGAARVVASLWDVDDRSVTLLMTLFYKGIIEAKLSPAQALRAAQLSMSKVEQWKSPYYWAGFKFHGEWR